MKFLATLAACFSLFAASATAAKDGLRNGVTSSLDHFSESDPEAIWYALTRHVESMNRGDVRNLQDDPTTELLDVACGIIGSLLPGAATCECSLGFAITYSCRFEQAICVGGLGGFCTKPLITGTLGLVDASLAFEYCAEGATNGGVSVPGLCVTFNEGLSDNDTEGEGGLSACSATMGGMPCKPCEMCADGKGYVFDCSNIDPSVVQSKCTAVQVIDSLTQEHSVAFLPQLD